MTEFSLQPGQSLLTHRVWGLGSIIGERQETIVQDSDYDDYDEIRATLLNGADRG